MRRTTIHLALTVAVLVVYSGVLLWVGPTSHVEQFPFFKWQLFSKVPSEINTSYGVRLLEVDGQELDPPRYFEKSDDLFGNRARSPEAATLLKSWGGHLEAFRPLRAEASRELFETRFLQSATTVHYEVVKRRYDIIERVECDCFVSEEVIGEYHVG